jgi:two-component system LytT family sensor kinase
VNLSNSLFLQDKQSYDLEQKKRYPLKRVATVTAVFCLAMFLLQALFTYLLQEKGKVYTLFSLRKLASHGLGFLFLTSFYYSVLNRYYALAASRKPFRKYIPFTILALAVYAAYYTGMLFLFPEKATENMSGVVMAISTFIGSCFMTAAGLFIAYLTSLRDEQKKNKILEKQKMELEVENSQANFNFLKAQINPHFLHNTLNFFYAKALPLSSELSEGILCLSDIMRYALNEGGKDEKALLKDEIEHLENVIKINQFRFSNNLNVQFEVSGVTAGAMIVPFVLITLVENAFKHGDLKNRDNPIVIRVIVENKRLHFYCRNKKNPGFKDISTGIGLQNILKRLDIMYGNDYSYKVQEDADFYSTELIINTL